MRYSKSHPLAQRVLAGVLSVTMVTSGVPSAAYAEAAADVGVVQDQQTEATLETQATTAPTVVQIQKAGSEVTSSTSVAVGDALTAVPGTEEEDEYWDTEFTALADTTGCTYQWYRGTSALYSSTSSHDTYTAIEGATDATYTTTDADAGSYLAVTVTYEGTELWTSTSTGAIKAAGAVDLGSVELTGSATIGSVLTAKAWAGSSWSKQEVPEGTTVTYTWRYADTATYGTTWTTIEGVTGDTLTLTEAYRGKYISVVADAGGKKAELSSYSALGPVVGEGEAKLYSVAIDNTAPQVGDTLTATANKSYYTKVDADTKVIYTWYAGDEQVQTGESNQLAVTDAMAGKAIKVEASAGVNTVTSEATSVVKLAGAVEIYSAYVTTSEGGSSTAKYTATDTLWAYGKEKGASDSIDPSNLNFQWQVSDDNKTWTDIEGATDQSLALADYTGRYVRCHVSAKVGDSSYDTRSRNKVAPVGTVDVASVTVDKTGTVQVGDTLTATATDQAKADVTANSQVTWQWYASDTTYGTGSPIEGATSNTLTVTDALNGKYLIAHANGSGGAWSDATSSKVGPVKVAGAVTLYSVEVSGKATIGETVTAQAYKENSYTKVEASDTVQYQWQYADSKTTTDSDFHDIPGATEAAYSIPQTIDVDGSTVELTGKYLRVKATSDGSVVSTSKKSSYYGTTAVDPLGPITVKGGYDLTGVKVTSDKTNAQVGATLSGIAQYLKQGTYTSYDADVPDDAEVTYVWHQADDAAGTNGVTLKTETITGPTASTITLTSDQLGKYVWVEATAHMKAASSDKLPVAAADTYSLHHIVLGPSGQKVLTGAEVSASVYASQLGSSTNTEVTGKDGVTVTWYVADTADASDDQWTSLGTGATLTVPTSAAGKYLRAVAASGSSSANATFADAVVDSSSLEGATVLLADWRPSLTYGTDTNINDVLKTALEAKGFDTTGLTVKVKDATFSNTNSSATVAIANEDSDRNGDVTYFYIDPTQTTSWGVTALHTVNSITFTLSRDGEDTVEYSPSKTFQIPWDEAKLGELLQQRADEIALGYTDGDTAESVTGNLTLPYKAGTDGGASWTSVSWSVPEGTTALAVSGSGWGDYTGTVTRGITDAQVKLTATVTGNTNYDMPEGLTATHDFDLTIKADPEQVKAAAAELQSKLDATFTTDSLTDFSTGAAIDASAVTGDLQMPRPKAYGLDGGEYSITYSSDNAAVTFNGYHAQVVRPFGTDATANVTCTITSKANVEITASKTLSLTVKAVTEADIDAEIALLDKVEAAYKSALLNGQTEPAGENLSTFQKAYLDADGNVVFARSVTEAAGHTGIVPAELDGYDDMGSYDQARLFKSSNTDVVLNETLQLAWNADNSTMLSQWHAQPRYNTTVTIGSKLASEMYAGYYAQYKDSADVSQDVKDKLARLAGDDVSADIQIAGTTGSDSPTPSPTPTPDDPSTKPDDPTPTPSTDTIHTTVSVVVLNDDGSTTSWLTGTTSAETKSGSTAADATKQVLKANGIGYDASLLTFTKGGTSLGWNETTGQYWTFYVNGTYSNRLASNVKVTEGDTYSWIYKSDSQALPTDNPAKDDTKGDDDAKGDDTKANDDSKDKDVEVTPEKARPTSTSSDWSGFRGDGSNTSTAATPTESASAAWTQKVYTRQGTSDMSGVSDPILVGGKVVIAVGDTLQVRSSSTGAVERTATLAASIDSTCRMAYADGIIIVPLHGGRLQALTADDLTTVWVTDAVASDQQSLSTLTVSGGYVYAGTSNASKTSGTLRRVSLADGTVDWSYSPSGSAYYWSGAAVTSSGIVIAQNSGELDLMSTSGSNGTGRVIASLKLGSQVSSSVVSDGGSTVYAMGYDGTLYKVTVGSSRLTLAGSVKLGSYSVSTPTIYGGKVYVGGTTAASVESQASSSSSSSTGALFVVDASTLKVEHTITAFDDGTQIGGSVSGSPLVVAHDGATYAYFVPNDGSFGGIGVYKLGDSTAHKLYVPGEGQRDYSLSSVVVDASGALYYVNDSGTLFKIVGSAQPVATGVEVYRLYNRWSGEHLFTLSASERDVLVPLGWTSEGTAWVAPTAGTPVYRLYNPYSGDHHYTSDKSEYDYLQTLGWNGEGVSFYSAGTDGKPIYRLFNKWLTQGTHLFTTNAEEYEYLGGIGWQQEGIAFYGL